MSDVDGEVAEVPEHEHRTERIKEASTMALYVAICLLAALSVASDDGLGHGTTFQLVWGTTLGLALAHWFAFRVSARLVAAGRVRRADAELAIAQFAGSVLVALLATVTLLLFDDANELSATRWVLAAFVAFVAAVVAHGAGASRFRTALYASSTTAVALVVVTVKNGLLGH